MLLINIIKERYPCIQHTSDILRFAIISKRELLLALLNVGKLEVILTPLSFTALFELPIQIKN